MGNCMQTKQKPKSIISKESVFYNIQQNKSVYVKDMKRPDNENIDKKSTQQSMQTSRIKTNNMVNNNSEQKQQNISLNQIQINKEQVQNYDQNQQQKQQQQQNQSDDSNNNNSNNQNVNNNDLQFPKIRRSTLYKLEDNQSQLSINLKQFGKIPQILDIDSLQKQSNTISTMDSELMNSNRRNSQQQYQNTQNTIVAF